MKNRESNTKGTPGTESAGANTKTRRTRILVGCAAALLLAAVVILTVVFSAGTPRTLTYSVYPYLPDAEYYRQIVEAEWQRLHPDVRLTCAPYDCYLDGRPEGIDVIMYDSLLERDFVENGYLKPLDLSGLKDADDFYGFTLEPAAGYTEHYGAPVFLCCDLLIYDGNNKALSEAETVFDLASSDCRVPISFTPYGDSIYLLDAAADIAQDAEATQFKERAKSIDVSASKQALADAAAPEYTNADANAFAGLYDAGEADGYVGYPETMRFLGKRSGSTEVKQISVSGKDNVPLFYCDLAGISAGVPDDKLDLCMELIGVMTDAEVMKRLSVKDGAPQYLMFPRRSFYEAMEKEYPMYAKLGKIAADDRNKLFRAYGSFMKEIGGN